MIHPGRITTRTQLLEKAYRFAPTRACSTAIRESRVRVIGGFSNIPPFDLPGWICCIRSKYGRVWLLAVLVDEIAHTYSGGWIDEIPWKDYVCVSEEVSGSPYVGDYPEMAKEFHMLAQRGDSIPYSDDMVSLWFNRPLRG